MHTLSQEACRSRSALIPIVSSTLIHRPGFALMPSCNQTCPRENPPQAQNQESSITGCLPPKSPVATGRIPAPRFKGLTLRMPPLKRVHRMKEKRDTIAMETVLPSIFLIQ